MPDSASGDVPMPSSFDHDLYATRRLLIPVPLLT